MATEKSPQPAKPGLFMNGSIPLAIGIACLTIALLAQAGYIDLPKLGKQSEYPLEPPKDDDFDSEPIKLSDGKVGTPYHDSTLSQLKEQMIAKDACSASCKFFIEEFDLPAGLKFNPGDLSISGTPIQAETWTFSLCWKDADEEGCSNPEFSITIKPKEEEPKTPYAGPCPAKPNPPCYSMPDGKGDLLPTAIGTLTYDYCTCPEGTSDSGERDAITSPPIVYKMCTCD